MTETKTMALYTPVPVAIHMWFADGAGWAYHPDIGETMLEEIVRSVTPDLYSSKSDASALRDCDAGLLVIEKSRQEQCADPRAMERSPHILRVALVPSQMKDASSPTDGPGFCDEICRQLKNLASPTIRGRCDSLRVWLAVDMPQASAIAPEREAPIEALPIKTEVERLATENVQLKQEINDLRRANEGLRKAIPTRRQRLANTVIILVLSAVLTTAALFLAGLLSGFQ